MRLIVPLWIMTILKHVVLSGASWTKPNIKPGLTRPAKGCLYSCIPPKKAVAKCSSQSWVPRPFPSSLRNHQSRWNPLRWDVIVLRLCVTDILYAFPSLEVLLSVCRRLNTLGFSEPCSAWKRDDGQYLLLLSEREENLYIPLSELTFLCEYGTKENAESALLLLEEHGTCLCRKNTVAAFARL